MEVRKARPEDADNIVECMKIYREELVSMHDYSDKGRKRRSESAVKESLLEEIGNEDGLFLLSIINGEITGIIYAFIRDTQGVILEPVKTGEIRHLWVSNEHRGKGISTGFRDMVISWLSEKGCGFVRVTVLSSNPAKEIYKKWGFTTVSLNMKKKI